MKKNTNRKKGVRLTALIAAVLLCMISLNALAESIPVTFNTNSRVYQKASTKSAWLNVSKGLKVNLLATKNGWAQVELNGVIAYTNANHLTEQTNHGALVAQDAVINTATRVYQKASTRSASLWVSKGTEVDLLATSGSWAMIRRAGVTAYIPKQYVTLAADYVPEPDYNDLIENAQKAYITVNTRVYQKANTRSASLKVNKGMQVNLLAVSGGWAMVENSGVIAYMNREHLTTEKFVETPATAAPAATPAPVPTATPEPEQPDYSGYLSGAKDAVINTDTRVYKFADLNSSYIEISKGTAVRLLAVNGGWALIEKSGVYGFTSEDHVSLAVKATPTPKPTATPAPAGDYFASDKYSNEQKCYIFLTREAGLNCAAACGILANIRRESNFNPASGSSYYGLCQWGGGRLTNLKNFCASNGYSASSLEGQLNFLIYELAKNYSSSVYAYLKNVPDTAQGAYDAAYHFCYYYERPANKASSSATRGDLARSTYYPLYS